MLGYCSVSVVEWQTVYDIAHNRAVAPEPGWSPWAVNWRCSLRCECYLLINVRSACRGSQNAHWQPVITGRRKRGEQRTASSCSVAPTIEGIWILHTAKSTDLRQISIVSQKGKYKIYYSITLRNRLQNLIIASVYAFQQKSDTFRKPGAPMCCFAFLTWAPH